MFKVCKYEMTKEPINPSHPRLVFPHPSVVICILNVSVLT